MAQHLAPPGTTCRSTCRCTWHHLAAPAAAPVHAKHLSCACQAPVMCMPTTCHVHAKHLSCACQPPVMRCQARVLRVWWHRMPVASRLWLLLQLLLYVRIWIYCSDTATRAAAQRAGWTCACTYLQEPALCLGLDGVQVHAGCLPPRVWRRNLRAPAVLASVGLSRCSLLQMSRIMKIGMRACMLLVCGAPCTSAAGSSGSPHQLSLYLPGGL